MATSLGVAQKRRTVQKRKNGEERDIADSTESSDLGTARKRVRWDGDVIEQESEETDDTEEESARSEKVCSLLQKIYIVLTRVEDMHGCILPIVGICILIPTNS